MTGKNYFLLLYKLELKKENKHKKKKETSSVFEIKMKIF